MLVIITTIMLKVSPEKGHDHGNGIHENDIEGQKP